MDYLFKYDKSIPGEVLLDNYCVYKENYLSGKSSSDFYYKSGFVIDFSTYINNDECTVFCFLHQINDLCDIESVLNSVRVLIDEQQKVFRVSYEIFASVKMSIAEKFVDSIEMYRFKRYGISYRSSFNIQKISNEDIGTVKSVIAEKIENDSHFGRVIAKGFMDFCCDDINKLIGCFEEDKLCGIASYAFFEEADMAELSSIYVLPEFRNIGVGKELVLSALNEYPNKQWIYQAGAKNEMSIRLAQSTGFKLSGAALYIRV